MQIDALGVFGHLISRSLTLREAIETAMGAMPAFNSGSRYWLGRQGDRVRLCHRFIDGVSAGYRQADQYWSMLAVNVLRLGAGDIEVLSDARIVFEQRETAVSFSKSLLSRPLAPACAAPRMEDQDVEAWKASAPADDLPGSVLQVIEALSSPDYPRIGLTADAIGMSVRVLQRRLAEAGVSYERLVARARFGTAVHLLEGTDARVVDIALDLGYSDHAHFTRAFRRWTGIPPREFRQMTRRVRRISPAWRQG